MTSFPLHTPQLDSHSYKKYNILEFLLTPIFLVTIYIVYHSHSFGLKNNIQIVNAKFLIVWDHFEFHKFNIYHYPANQFNKHIQKHFRFKSWNDLHINCMLGYSMILIQIVIFRFDWFISSKCFHYFLSSKIIVFFKIYYKFIV